MKVFTTCFHLQKLTPHFSTCLFILGMILYLIFSDLNAYEVRFEGVQDPELLELIQSVSQLEKLKESPPATATGLKRRIEADIPTIIQALHSKAYYDAKVDFNIMRDPTAVIIRIEPGQVYPLGDVRIIFKDGEPDGHCSITTADLKVEVGAPALPGTILDGEDTLLDLLNLKGYAFAAIEKRDVLIDQQRHLVFVIFYVQKGPLTYFGPVHVSGLERVRESFFDKKLYWTRGDLYDPLKVEKTQEALELSGLFKSVNIAHAEHPSEGGEVPIQINVVEAKQRSIGFGVNYTTELGPGITGEWEDRNYGGEGQKLSFRADIWQSVQEGRLTYLIPDFRRHNQNLIWQAQYNHQRLEAFTDSTFSVSGIIERQLNKQTRISYGGRYKFIRSRDSDNNGTFDLLQAPLQMRWSNADSLLNPTKGHVVDIKVIPSWQFLSPQFAYSINTFTGTLYQSLWGKDRAVFAAKLMLGSIIGANKHDIPPPERFYAGSENTLRGYKYLTVSPLDCDDKPIGGRSLMILSLETRFRIGENLGWVAFYDIGNVYATSYPLFNYKQLQSVGIGLRYHTPVGPLRCDIAFPLNRRRHLDGAFQIYFSIGQAF
jgi:translocation and assembly module TamA